MHWFSIFAGFGIRKIRAQFICVSKYTRIDTVCDVYNISLSTKAYRIFDNIMNKTFA